MRESIHNSEPIKASAWIRASLFGLIMSVFVAVISVFLPNHYRSSAKVLPPDSSGGGFGANLANLTSLLGLPLGGGNDNQGAEYLAILKSRYVGEAVLQKSYSFDEKSSMFGSPKHRQQTLMEYLEAKNLDRGMAKLDGIENVQLDAKTGILTLEVTTISPQLSQQVLNDSLDLLEQFKGTETRRSGLVKERFSSQMIIDAKRDMDEAESKLRGFLAANRNFDSTADPDVRLAGIRLQNEMDFRRQVLSSLTMARQTALLSSKNDIPVLRVLDRGNLPIEKSWPPRALIVILTFFATAFAAWSYSNRSAIRAYFNEDR